MRVICQVDKIDLSPDELCDPNRDWSHINMAMGDWGKTSSPPAYWHRKMLDHRKLTESHTLSVDLVRRFRAACHD